MTRSVSCAAWLLAIGTCALAGDLRSDVDGLIEAGEPQAAVALVEERSPEATRGADEWVLIARAYHAWLEDAGLLRKRGLAKRMKQSLERALVLEPGHVEARSELIDYLHYAPAIVGGDDDEARRQLEVLEEIDAGAAWALRGAHARNAGDTAAARDHYRRALAAGPREPDRLLVLAVLEQHHDDYDASVALLDELLAADPGNEKAAYYRARSAAMTGEDLDRGLAWARRYLASCVECDDEDRAFGNWRMATILKRQGRAGEAAAAYRRALALNPGLEGARQGLAELER